MKNDRKLLFAERIAFVMRQRKISEAALARDVRMPQATISRVLSGSTQDPRVSTIMAIADALGTSIGYLMDSADAYRLPVLPWRDVLSFTGQQHELTDHADWIAVSTAPVRGSFAARTTPAMEPRYRNGSTVIVEPAQTYNDFQIVVVSFDGEEPVVRRLVKDGGAARLLRIDAVSGDASASLSPGIRIIGAITEARMAE